MYSALLWDQPIARDAQIWLVIARRSHSFTCYPLTNHTCLYSPAAEHHRPLAFTHCAYPRRDGQAELTLSVLLRFQRCSCRSVIRKTLNIIQTHKKDLRLIGVRVQLSCPCSQTPNCTVVNTPKCSHIISPVAESFQRLKSTNAYNIH